VTTITKTAPWDTGDVTIIAKKYFGTGGVRIVPTTATSHSFLLLQLSAAVTIRILLTKFCILLLSFNV